MRNILILSGGIGSEREISFKSLKYLESQIDTTENNIFSVRIEKDFWKLDGKKVFLRPDSKLYDLENELISNIDYVIPCLHGFPGETGHIAALLESFNIPFLGNGSEACKITFNKVATKIWLEHFSLKTTPFISLHEKDMNQALSFWNENQPVFIKASSEGSSIGCYPVEKREQLETSIEEAFKFSNHVIIEKLLKAREIEVAVFKFNDKIYVSNPGEVVTENNFYSYSEKYDKKSKSKVKVQADLNDDQIELIKKAAKKSFDVLKLKDLARIDFFLTNTNEILINEINSFPGLTEISLFPRMLEKSGITFKDFLKYHIN